MTTQAPDRTELERALRDAGCRIDIDTALASPALARCLELTVDAMRRQTNPSPILPASTVLEPWAVRLRRLVGDLDHQALRAGGDGN
ncbi:hypothetical protein [Castellaniella sp.]|uniref:hypothetical protein n=1 Tax=Castellaniella sp. TaxID=1955812 RepID=UPI003A93AA75